MNKRLFSYRITGLIFLLAPFISPHAFASDKFPETFSGTEKYAPVDEPGMASIIVKGTIRDQDGNALAGASITEKGTNNTMISGSSGAFTITVNEGATLVVSFVGFETQELAAMEGTDMDIRLTRLDRIGSEIVVTALGIRKEKGKIGRAHV